ncbi:hypothetical protein RDABS01_004359 [Bienertia sinuspersici]
MCTMDTKVSSSFEPTREKIKAASFASGPISYC